MKSPRTSKTTVWVSALVLLALLLAACAGATPPATAADPNLTGSDWQLTSINDVPAVEQAPATLSFGDPNIIAGSTGCNIYTGNYEVGADANLRLSQTISTAFTCHPSLKAQEEAMQLVFNNTQSYSIEGDTLTITSPDNSRRATFNRIPDLVLSATSWVLDSYDNGQGAIVQVLAGTQITADFSSDGKLTGSAGCNTYNATYTVDGDKVTIGPAATTMMACSEPQGIMEQETAYLQALNKAVTYRNLAIAMVLFDANGLPVARYLNPQYSTNIETVQ